MYSYLIFAVALFQISVVSNSEFQYPCPSLDNECISKYFNAHAKTSCREGTGCCAAPEPRPTNGLLVKYSSIYLPILNCTAIRHNMAAPHALNGKVTAFLVDKTSNYTIMTITYTDFLVTIDKVDVLYYRTALPPLYTNVNSTTVLKKMDLTVYFKGYETIDLLDSFTFVAVSGGGVMINTNPSIAEYKGTEFEPLFSTIAENYSGYVKEREAPPQGMTFSAFYIQNNICNFGVNVKG